MGTIQIHDKTSRARLSAHFSVPEFRCHGANCCDSILIDDALVAFLQQIRAHFGKPVTINSGYRCPSHNAAIGGAANSYHCRGMAADISVADTPPAAVAAYAQHLGVPGIGLYETAQDGFFVHIDTRPQRFYWYGQRCIPKNTFLDDANIRYRQALQAAMGISDLGALLAALPTVGECCNCCHRVITPTQQYLFELGYREVGSADGIAGPKFAAALKQFQQAHGCAPTGIAEQWGKTWHMLLGESL